MPFIKNIETKMKMALWIAITSMVTAIIIVIIALSYTTKMITSERKHIYVLDKNIPLVAVNADMDNYKKVEYKTAVETFHQFFFTLPPDDKFIESQMQKAMYLVDASGVAQYNTLKEKGYFTNLIATNSVSTLVADSVLIDMNSGHFIYYGKQKIQRPSMITIRSLITEGYLIDQPVKTDSNPYGVLITNWKIIENKDLQNETQKLF
ncbi:conjugative transposon protein TraK [Arachidicoccus soli]|uniref:Conjugative transposon protein TraK n=1 Tax=Arachidicoccus soli TaxID=2341117 RepID=A0A386HT93_9BACT|nr:conjugative transposon protein TraK [Arachidicoccus soli]AYD49033.1 conjugative transposon protein TraK [Arachidicoccus soli]